MALSVNPPPKRRGRKKMVPAPERLKLTQDGRLVPSSSPEPGTLWAPHKGYLVPEDELNSRLEKRGPGRPKGSKNKPKE